MIPSKKIEIITSSSAEELVIAALSEAGLKNYTLIDRVQGSGKRGKREDDDFMDLMHNCLFIIVCDQDKAHKAVARLEKIIKEFGGVVILSDCLAILI